MNAIAAPFAWLLRQLIVITGSYGISIILFALLLKVVMLPFVMKSKMSTMRMQRMTPYVKELEKKHGGNKQKYQEEVTALYRDEKINPMSGCLWSFLPFPLLIALYGIVREPMVRLMGLTTEELSLVTDKLVSMGVLEMPEKVGSFFQVQVADLVHQNFESISGISSKIMDIDFNFSLINLANIPQWNFFMRSDISEPGVMASQLVMFLIPVIGALLTFLQMKMSMSSADTTNQSPDAPNMNMMMYTMPVMSLVMGYTLPAAMGIYWMVGYIWGIPETHFSNKYFTKKLDAEDAERIERLRKKEQELEQKRLETERLKAEGLMERNRNTSKRKRQVAERTKQEERLAALRNEDEEMSPSQVDNRRYARGRAYVADRYTNPDYTEFSHDENEDDDEYGIDDYGDAEYGVDEYGDGETEAESKADDNNDEIEDRR